MSELDLGGSPAPLTPPTTEAVLAPPAAVPVVQNDQAVGMVPVPAEKQTELTAKAKAFVAGLAAESPQSPAFAKKVDDIVRMGEAEIRSSAQVSNRMLERPSSSLAANQGRGAAAEPAAKVSRTLQDLRDTVTDLDPSRADLRGVRKVLGFLPGGSRVVHYFERYQSAQSHLDAIITALVSGQDELRRDNAAIEQERAELWTTMGTLAEYATLAKALDDATVAKVDELRSTDPRAADLLTSDALFPIRQRRQDLTTQIAVSVQGYLALDMVRKNNLELVKGVERARTTTVAALRTAVVVAQALANQKLVLDQIGALNDTTNALIGSTSQLLRQQTAGVQQQASSSGVSVETLQKAFDDVFATIDAIDTYKAQAVTTMAQTVDALEQQVTRSRGYLERSHEQSEPPAGSISPPAR